MLTKKLSAPNLNLFQRLSEFRSAQRVAQDHTRQRAVKSAVNCPTKKKKAAVKVDAAKKKPATVNSPPTATSPCTAHNTVYKRKKRYYQRRKLIDNAPQVPEQQQAAKRLALNNDNILRAEAAAYVYRVDEFNRGYIQTLPKAPTGLKTINPNDIPGLENAVFTDKQTGFGAALFQSKINGETMLTFRGTNNGVTGTRDWMTNWAQVKGWEAKHYDQAMRLSRQVNKNVGDDFCMVGHSLGGGLASSGTAVTGVKAYTFNSAGLHRNTAQRAGGMNNNSAAGLIQTQAVSGEFLTCAQWSGNTALLGLSTGIGTLIGGGVGGLLGFLSGKAIPSVPSALGEMHRLPSIKGGSAVARHSMGQVMEGIEAQKKEDIATLQNYPHQLHKQSLKA